MVDNQLISKKLFRIASLLKFEDPDGYKATAFERAAYAVKNLKQSVGTMDYLQIKGIGKSTGACIQELLDSNGMLCTRLSTLEEEFPPTIMTLTEIDRVNAARAKSLAEKYKVANLMELYALVKEGKKKIPKKLSADVIFAVEEKQRKPRYAVMPFLDVLRAHVHAHPNVTETAWVGSVRRCRPAIKNADLLITLEGCDRDTIFKYLREEVIQKEYQASMLTVGLSGKAKEHLAANWPVGEYGFLPVEFITTTPERAGAAKFFFTGSKAHNTAVSRLAREKEMTIDERGILNKKGALIGGADEREVYRKLGLHYWPPEFRDEVDLSKIPPTAENNGITKLNATRALHVHSDWSDDGHQNMKEAAEAAQKWGVTELVFTDHAYASKFKAVDSEIAYIQACHILTSWFDGLVVKAGIEVDIEVDGTLSWPQPRLQQMDFVVAAIHRKPEVDVEKRLLSAIYNPTVKMIGHITGRLIGKRGIPENVDWQKVFTAAAMNDVIIEINCHPMRLDPPRDLLILAKQCGCKFAISDDAHSIDQFFLRENGIELAKRAWLNVHDLAK